MKKLITLIALATITLSLSAQARSIKAPRAFNAEITNFFVDQQGPLGSYKIQYGDITVNEANGKITLALELGPNCAPGMMCPMYLISRKIEIGNMKANMTRCGVVTYTATVNKMPVDGAKQTLTVVDYSKNRCPVLMWQPYMETGVTYSTQHYNRIEGKLESSTSTFHAKRLEQIPTTF